MWISNNGRQIHLKSTRLQELTEVERKSLHRVALDRISQLNIGVTVKPPNGKYTTFVKLFEKNRFYPKIKLLKSLHLLICIISPRKLSIWRNNNLRTLHI